MIHQVISSNRASIKQPFLHFSTTLTVMPVNTCKAPRISEPTMMAMVSSRGENSAGRAKVLSGSKNLKSCGRKSPKKLPVMAPKTTVVTPHQKIISIKLRSSGRFFFRNSHEPRSISSP